jgi:hypothetical protein
MLKKTVTITAAAAALLFSAATLAGPPRGAPAHGWRVQEPAHYDHRHGWRAHQKRKVVVIHHHPQPRVRHVYAPAPRVVVHHRPAYVVPSAVIGATPIGWSLDLRLGGHWR